MKLNNSYILLNNLHYRARHGVMPQEHVTGNDYTVSLRLGVDVSQAAATDRIEDTVSYADVYRLVSEEMAQESQLIEHVAHRIAQRISRHYPNVSTIDITLTKHNPPIAGADCEGVAVEMHYNR